MMMRKQALAWCLSIIILLGLGAYAVRAHLELESGRFIALVDEKNRTVHQTAMQVYPGDIYIAADNSRYRVEKVSGRTAHCVYEGQEKMPVISEKSGQAASGYAALPAVSKGKKPTIAVYHTHSDESYVPSDGKESTPGNGGIYDVGASFVQQLRSMGFDVQYNKQNHNPHDINAYHRSRKTASTLLKRGPDAIIDIHRDAVPPGEYQTTVKGQKATKVKLVVGRTNPNMKTNMEFARNLKATMDKNAPGLSNGIFIGKGDYNQDLSPRAILAEVGAHTNSKEEAERGVKLFAQTLPTVLGVSGAGVQTAAEPAQKPLSNKNQGAGSTIIILLLVVGAVVGGFYFLNRGSTSK